MVCSRFYTGYRKTKELDSVTKRIRRIREKIELLRVDETVKKKKCYLCLVNKQISDQNDKIVNKV